MREMHFRPLYEEEEISFYDSCAHIFTPEVCDTFLRTFNIGKIYLTGLVWQEHLFGLVGIFHGPGEELVNKQAIESFLRQASIAIARRLTEERLLRSEQQFRDLVNTLDLPAVVILPDSRISLINSHFIRIFGYSCVDIPTEGVFFEKAFPDPEYRKSVVAGVNHGNRDPGSLMQRNVYMRSKDGETKSVVLRHVHLSDGTRIVFF